MAHFKKTNCLSMKCIFTKIIFKIKASPASFQLLCFSSQLNCNLILSVEFPIMHSVKWRSQDSNPHYSIHWAMGPCPHTTPNWYSIGIEFLTNILHHYHQFASCVKMVYNTSPPRFWEILDVGDLFHVCRFQQLWLKKSKFFSPQNLLLFGITFTVFLTFLPYQCDQIARNLATLIYF